MTVCCDKCKIRIWYARKLDIHFYGDDCFYECEKYEQEKAKYAEFGIGKEGEQK